MTTIGADELELVVVGAGPAGIGAALAAREHGVNVLVVDEGLAPGGQIYRAAFGGQPGTGPVEPDAEAAFGDRLRHQLQESGAHVLSRARVWCATPGFRVDALVNEAAGPRHAGIRAKTLVAACGTTERIVPFPGWTMPGVVGLAAATTMMKSQFIVPGERTVVAGAGPLLAAVAAGFVKAGVAPVAVVDLASRAEWLARLPRMAVRLDLVRRGVGWLHLIRKAGVPILHRHAVDEVRGTDNVDRVVVRAVDATGGLRSGVTARTFDADALAVGHGLAPASELTRLLGARHVFDAQCGGWVAQHDDSFRTSVSGLYAAGDGAGVFGAAAALIQGRIAGHTAALDLGRTEARVWRSAVTPLRRALARARQFGTAMSSIGAPRPGLIARIAPDTVVCRCEDVTRGAIDEAIQNGACEVNQVKAWTRCGMGPCQGRVCGDTVAHLVAERVGSRVRAGIWTARAPLRPVAIDELPGQYEYADIPMPEDAPS
ncbi:MAG: FAD-dependent oxidoreductase [Gammaproteobacteria bacterium]